MTYTTTRISALMRRDRFLDGRTISVRARKMQKAGYHLVDRLMTFVTMWSILAVASITALPVHAFV
jgi:hypothetical protein